LPHDNHRQATTTERCAKRFYLKIQVFKIIFGWKYRLFMLQLDEQLLKKIFWVLLATIFVYMMISVPLYGITGDEITQKNYGNFVWDYIRTFGANKAVLNDEYILKKELQYYGGFFDGFSAMLISLFHPKDEFLFRHYWTALFGFTGIMATGLIAKQLRGWLAAILAVIFIFFTGRYFGEAFNNPKDAPFAASYALALYAMLIWLKNIEQLKWKHTLLLGLAIALCLSIRIGGLLLVAYLGLFYVVTLWQKKLTKTKGFSNSIKHLLVAGVIGYVGAILWWPYALDAPLSNPINALHVMSTNPLASLTIRMLFDGHIIQISPDTVPWYYLPRWLEIGLPLYLLTGTIGGSALVYQIMKRFQSPQIWMIVFAGLFPVAYILYKHSVLYDGIRHVMFIIPPMAVISALFFNYLAEIFPGKGVKYAVAAVVVILIALPARFSFANHPNEYVYFNEIIGGIKGAYGNYETDYYMNGIKQGYKWLVENELKNRPAKDTAVVATNCGEPLVEYARVSSVPFVPYYVRFYQKNQKNWDYGIYYGRFLDKQQLQNGYFPSSMAIHVVSVDGVPLCAVLKNDADRNGFKGYEALKQKDIQHAIEYLSAASGKHPEDMEIWDGLAEAYAGSNNMEGAQNAVNKAMAISSIDLQTAFMAGQIALQRRDLRKAGEIFGALKDEYPDMDEIDKYLNEIQKMQRGGIR
jgi:Dolichyl-phosphate-mannose-protein mannosyltransferase